MASPPDDYVSDWKLRALFNDGGYYDGYTRGTYKIEQRKKPASDKYRKLFGEDTLSVKTEAFDKITGEMVFKTHHFESQSGDMLHCDKITGVVTPTGKMDPKRLLHNGVLYHLDESILDT